MKNLFTKNQILTIPNLLTIIRLMLIPLFVWLYIDQKNYQFAAAIIILSGITDVADGFIARKCNMVSDLGKIIDPIADKLTQISVAICLANRYKLMIILLGVFVLKELVMLVLGYMIMKKKDSINSSKWHGKLSTVALYISSIFLILFPNVSVNHADIIIIGNIVLMLTSFVLYIRFYRGILRERGV